MECEETARTIVLDSRKFSKMEIAGTWMTPDEVIREIVKDRIFYEESGGGVTFSGGEPLLQNDFLSELLDRAMAEGIHTVLDTSGYAEKEVFRQIVDKPDLYYYDIKLIDDTDHQEFTGVSNRMILENLLLLCRSGKNVVLRFPVIPGITDTRKNIDGLKALLLQVNDNFHEIDILPWHSLAASKYHRFGKPGKMENTRDLKKEDLAWIKAELEECGILVRIGG
jgi:pyruvate formate lyase activating enzyme